MLLFTNPDNFIFFFWINRYVLEKKSDDSILLILIIRIIDALGNYGTNFCV